MCPNYHARIHYGSDGETFNGQLIDRLGRIESDDDGIISGDFMTTSTGRPEMERDTTLAEAAMELYGAKLIDAFHIDDPEYQ